MAAYKVGIKRSAEKELRAIPKADLTRITRKIQALSDNPRPHGTEEMKGQNLLFRIRQGDYRILYEINDTQKEIVILKIGHRREVYR